MNYKKSFNIIWFFTPNLKFSGNWLKKKNHVDLSSRTEVWKFHGNKFLQIGEVSAESTKTNLAKINVVNVWKFFWNKLLCFLHKIETQIAPNSEEVFVKKWGFLASKKYKNKLFWLNNIYLTKLKVGPFHSLLKTLK